MLLRNLYGAYRLPTVVISQIGRDIQISGKLYEAKVKNIILLTHHVVCVHERVNNIETSLISKYC